MKPDLKVASTLLGTLKLRESQATLTETVLQLMEKLLVEAAASHQSLEQYQAFARAASGGNHQSSGARRPHEARN